MKKSIIASVLLLGISFGQYAIANVVKSCDGTVENPCIVQDTSNDDSKVKEWRTGRMIRAVYQGNTKGLKNLWVSVSGVPSVKTFKMIVKNVNKATEGKYRNIIDLDLREESHLYLNDNALTLTTKENWINKGKSHQQSVADEQSWAQELASKGAVANVLTKKQFHDGEFAAGTAVNVGSIKLEQNTVEALGFDYHRLTVSDHMRPGDEEVDSFVKLVRDTPDNVWIHMHCRGGNGRSTTFFAMYDMMKNADKVSFLDIIKRQASIKPFYDLSDINRKEGKMAKYYQERYQFLQHFYQFSSDSLNGYKGNWSRWVEENKIS